MILTEPVAAVTPFVLFDVPRVTICSAEYPLPESAAIARTAAHASARMVRLHLHEALRGCEAQQAQHARMLFSTLAPLMHT